MNSLNHVPAQIVRIVLGPCCGSGTRNVQRTARRVMAPLVGGLAACVIGWPIAAGAFNPQPEPPGHVIGVYRGYSQSAADPSNHPYMELIVASEDDKGRFFGILTMGSPAGDARVPFKGKRVDDEQGRFKGVASSPLVGEVRFEGVLQAVGFAEDAVAGAEGSVDHGVLVRASYKFTDVTGRVDRGTTLLLRSFDACSDCVPPDVRGDWGGRTLRLLTRELRTLSLRIVEQDATSFTGIAEVLGIEPEPFRTTDDPVGTLGIEPEPFAWTVVGTIGVRGNIVLIGAGDPGLVEVGAQYFPPDPVRIPRDPIHPPDPVRETAALRGVYAQSSATGARDLGEFVLRLPAAEDR